MPSRVWNVYDELMPSWMFLSKNKLYGQSVGHTIPQGSYEIVDILILIQFRLDKLNGPLTINLSDKNRVTLN